MSRILPDEEIRSLLAEPKVLPHNWRTRLSPNQKANTRYSQRDFSVTGDANHDFRIIIRKSDFSVFDFSIILIFEEENGEQIPILRYNGKQPSQHTNKFVKKQGEPDATFRNEFHIHRATERYQLAGLKIDGYAEVTGEYDSFDEALRRFVTSNGFEVETTDTPGQKQINWPS